jgi:hypothetical protein
MNGRIDAERVLDAFLAPESDRLPDRVIDAALADIARTPQRRALRVPWRFPLMTNTMRAAAGIAIVAIVGVGVLALNLRPAGNGASDRPAPTATPAPAPTTPGITGWTAFTSEMYGISFQYPDDWTVEARATRKPNAGDDILSTFAFSDVFLNPHGRDGDQIAFGVLQVPAGPGVDVASREGLAAWAAANACNDAIDDCETVPDVALPMCLGRAACQPAILVPLSDGTTALFANSDTGLLTVVSIFREDDFPAAARYGGSVQLLKSILATMDVWTPEPGQIAEGS